MSRRLAPTVGDYMVIAISPALIMLLVGSLVFFLLEVFYRGDYSGRMNFIMAMFVFASVLIARIAIEEGRGYANLFALPLGLVTTVAMARFVEFTGPLRSFSLFINIGLLLLIWWCADKLTWDSTVIDESKDASGEGLLQTVGLDGNEQPAATQDGTSARTESRQLTWWQRFIADRKRPHAPGVWVIYFSLAALPIFGFGNWFVPASDLEARRYVFKLLVVYVGSALGLLLTTSFLGLRRYLRQRRLEMPLEMAGTWLGVGAAMIVALLLICMFFPRRNPEYSITQLPIFAGSPTDLWTTEHAIGNEGQEDPEKADRTGQSQSQPRDNSQDGKKPEPSPNQSQKQGGQSDSEPSQSSEPSSQNSDSSSDSNQSGNNGSQSDNQSSSSDSSSSKQDSQSNQSNGKQESNSQNKSDSSSKTDSKDGQNSSEKNDSAQSSTKSDNRQQSSSSKSDDQKSQGQKSQDQKSQSKESENPDNKSDKKRPQTASSDQSRERQPSQERAPKENENSESPPKSQPQSSSRFDPSKLASAIGGSFGQLLKLLYWLIVAAFIAYIVWRYHRQIREALANFWKSLQDFWASLFGGKRGADEAEAEAAVAAGPIARPFSDFADPFLNGMAQQRPPAEVIRYSFEAFEAWARDHGVPRGPEQTPHEFAQLIGQYHVSLARDAAALAELYCRCAYSKDPTTRASFEHLRRLWQQLRSTAA